MQPFCLFNLCCHPGRNVAKDPDLIAALQQGQSEHKPQLPLRRIIVLQHPGCGIQNVAGDRHMARLNHAAAVPDRSFCIGLNTGPGITGKSGCHIDLFPVTV